MWLKQLLKITRCLPLLSFLPLFHLAFLELKNSDGGSMQPEPLGQGLLFHLQTEGAVLPVSTGWAGLRLGSPSQRFCPAITQPPLSTSYIPPTCARMPTHPRGQMSKSHRCEIPASHQCFPRSHPGPAFRGCWWILLKEQDLLRAY